MPLAVSFWLLASSVFAVPPPNDSFANAEVLPSGVTATTHGTTADATREVGDPEDAGHRTVWYSWAAPASGVVSISAVTTNNPIKGYVFVGDNILSGRYITSAVVSSSPIRFYAIVGHTYRLCIDDYVPGYINYEGYAFSLGLSSDSSLPQDTQFVPPLSNDDFAHPLTLNHLNEDFVLYTADATFEPFEQDMLRSVHASFNSGGDGGLWVDWTALITGTATFSARNISSTQIVLLAGTGSSISTLQLLAGAYGGFSFPCNQGVLYHLYVLNQSSVELVANITATRLASEVNVSTRMQVGTGDKAMIGGFIISGNVPKKVMVRAIGPSLAAAGIVGALGDPTLELHDGTGAMIASNDNWQTTRLGGIITGDQAGEIQNSSLAPTDGRESAIIATLAAGNYTAIIRGVNNSTGVGLVEVYDLDADAPSKLANISTRGFIQTGDQVMIGGFIVADHASRIIVRAIGPSLSSAGVAGALADPMLELHDGNGTIIGQNDNWRSNDATNIQNTNLAPTNNAESAILTTLAPGNYTAIVRGANGGTGIGLFDAYSLN